ncbi:hypothetical protein A8C32_11950 [Flavivirga aquatica]|uniref:Uncharacterized protein n=1 Tax=Flavivirga aquatica TaxID=1849968 RepID=A0A1E5TDH2_9FLAO|nr:hypothetical protein [Flavivirga aquatica]OEK09424.1 hypothetical protein A8C32_11950 [Flavivirga aquatica]
MKPSVLNLKEGEVKKDKSYADKEIITDSRKARREIYKGYYVYLIPKDKAVRFKILALKAVNPNKTENNVYWVAQPLNVFMSHKWLRFKEGGETVIQERTLAEHLTYLNEKSKDYKDVKYSEKSTRGVGKSYINASYNRDMGKDVFGSIKYTTNTLGAGIWLEGINYYPTWKSQGAFVIAVDEPQVMSFYAKKRISTVETQERKLKFIEKTIETLEDELEYGNIVDLHIKLHNVPYYDIELTIIVDGKELKKETIPLARNANPALDYNVEQRYELYINPTWIEILNHEEASIKEGKLQVVLVPNVTIMHAPYTKEQVKKIKKEITFKINYKDIWAIDDDEQEWIPQIAEIKEATLVTQEFEECGFTGIKISSSIGEPFYILKESEEGGCLEVNNTTPILEYVAGSKATQTITIDLEDIETAECQQKAGFDNTQDNSNSHVNNTFVTTHFPTEIVKSDLFGDIKPVKIITHNENSLKLEFAFPYQANNKLGIFTNYLFGGKYIEFPLIIKSCRYIRMPLIKLYADIEWFLKLKVASTQPETYSHTNMPNNGKGGRFEQHQKKATAAGLNKKWLNKEVSFELALNAKYNGNIQTPIISASYENKIRSILTALVKIKETIDTVCHVDKVKAKGMADKLAGKLKKLPIIIIIDYPTIEIEGSWKYEQQTNGVVVRTGSISLGFSPLIKGTGKIDLIACMSYIPLIGPIIKAADLAIAVAGGDVWFNLYAFGSIGFKGDIYFNQDKSFDLQSDTVLGVGAELGVKVEVSTKKLSFVAEKTKSSIGAELSAKGETSFTFTGKTGIDNKGTFMQTAIEFNGMMVSVTGKAWGYGLKAGVDDELYPLIKKPKEPILKKTMYILEK